ncbi:MAG: methyltransferase domain-containing protein, partial [Lysobacterales bacterium]
MKKTAVLLLLANFLAACGQGAIDTSKTVSVPAAPDKAVYARVVANPQRSEADRARDSSRKPGKVLEFFAVTPGMTVLDLFSGGGYYTELLADLVGDAGHVVAHTNEAYLGFVGDEVDARYANDRLPNVEIWMAENNQLDIDDGRFDAILMVLSYHDLYYAEPEQGWPKIDAARLLRELYTGLKPGGILGIVDHYAEAGAPR